METGDKSHVDLEDGGGGGRRHSIALSDGGSDNRSPISSDADGRSWNSASCSTAGALSSYNEQQRPSSLSAVEIVGVADKRRESSASVEVVDLESGVPAEAKAHLEKSERDCRICHLSLDATNPESGIPIDLGCSCKDDLAAAHKHCAEAWFKIKGNKICEICGSTARNIAVANEAELMQQRNDGTDAAAAAAAAVAPLPQAEATNFLQGHRFLNFLLACMVFAFVISWLFHFNVPS